MAVAPKGTKRSCPCMRPCASLRVRSLHRHSRGTPRRAIPGPSRLSRHPCRSTPSTAIPLTLLKGAVGVACRSVQKKQIKPKSSRATRSPSPSVGRVEVLRSSVGWKTAKPFPRVSPHPLRIPPPHHRTNQLGRSQLRRLDENSNRASRRYASPNRALTDFDAHSRRDAGNPVHPE